MSDELGEAIGAILGLGLGGVLLLKMATQLNSTGPVNFTFWGSIFLLGAVLGAVLLVYGLIGSVTR
ncbi:hypothetical protein [Halocalculus aciditolerans]|uniref:hypothetical protein n=1 Tax=Halocalculus aciditolerans TaxID=1383812 RepID=UPI0016676D62|nr:hypothetical protein [Halocalculus aciditolerans]